MPDHLKIALVSTALAVLWSYVVHLWMGKSLNRILAMDIPTPSNPLQFWTVFLILGVGEVLFVGLAVVFFGFWLAGL